MTVNGELDAILDAQMVLLQPVAYERQNRTMAITMTLDELIDALVRLQASGHGELPVQTLQEDDTTAAVRSVEFNNGIWKAIVINVESFVILA